MIAAMSDRQGIEPYGPQPWKKALTAGSDDHSGAYTATALRGRRWPPTSMNTWPFCAAASMNPTAIAAAAC